jgi:hypothetical protein
MDSHRNKQTAENQDPNRRNVYTLADASDLKTITQSKEERIGRCNIRPLTLIEMVLLSAVFVAFAPGAAGAQTIEKKGTTPYVTHFIFRPLMSIDIPGPGTATNLEAVGTTQN